MFGNKFGLIIGYHGCDLETRDLLVSNPHKVKKSEKPYDWLGHGFYVWEGNFHRALQWAKDKRDAGRINNPAVVGVVFTLGNCLDFTESQYLELLSDYYSQMKKDYDLLNMELPKNFNATNDPNNDFLIRNLDCTVIEYLHEKVEEKISLQSNSRPFNSSDKFDTTRGIFAEGGPVFDGAGIQKKTHSQICIRNTENIIGFFIPKS
jgi:hypothetical protein